MATAPLLDVDDLAREKVQEVEDILEDKHDNLKLDSIKCCFSILKQIITAADLHRTNNDDKAKSENNKQTKTENSESIYADYSDDHEQFNAVDLTEQFATNSVKWTIRVRAFKSVHHIFNSLISSTKLAPHKSAALKILPDLVRLSFVAATSPYDDLKIQGFQMFRELINRFALVEEREFPGHSILEQYKTQVLSALKPAFNLDAPPYITAIACQVCSQWICRGLEKEPTGLKRAYQLMKPSIEKLESQSINPNSLLYQEIELEQERLDILGSWAQLYTTSHETGETSKLLNNLIEDQVETLVGKWWEALKDYALLIMLSPKTITVSHDNEHVYTREVALRLFTPIWPKLTLAVTIWICTPRSKHPKFESESSEETTKHGRDSVEGAKTTQKYFRFLCGILMNEFCRCLQVEPTVDSLSESTTIALRSLTMLLSSEITNKNLLDEVSVAKEFYAVLGGTLIKLTNLKSAHRLLLKGTLSHIFKLILVKFKDNNQIVQYSLNQLIGSIRAGIEPFQINGHDVERTSQQLMFANLIAVAKSRPDILAGDRKLLDAFIDIISRILIGESNSSTTIFVIDCIQNLQKNLPKASPTTTVIIERMFEAKQSLSLKLLSSRQNDKPSAQNSEFRILFEAIIKSMRLDLELLSGSERQNMLASLIRTLLTNFEPSKDDKDFVNQITQILRDLEKNFAEDFTITRKSDLVKSMIDDALKSATKDEKDSKTSKKCSNVVKKPSSRIVLKSDFSNFYSKK